jgi:hypothetical protein
MCVRRMIAHVPRFLNSVLKRYGVYNRTPVMPVMPVDRSQFCGFGRIYNNGNDYIKSVIIKDSGQNVLLTTGPYTGQGPADGRDETSKICSCSSGMVLSITVEFVSELDCDYYGLMWGHTVSTEELVKIANLYAGIGPCAEVSKTYEYTYDWEVPNTPGVHMVSWWMHWLGYTDNESNQLWIGPCDGSNMYNQWGDRVDCTLVIQ